MSRSVIVYVPARVVVCCIRDRYRIISIISISNPTNLRIKQELTLSYPLIVSDYSVMNQ